MSYTLTPQLIYEQTNGGLDIILKYYPDAEQATRVKSHKFAIRDEKTPSCILREYNGIWWVKDFGSGEKSFAAVDIVMREEALPFSDALRFIADEFGIAVPDEKVKAKAQYTYKKRPAEEGEVENQVKWEKMEYTIAGMKAIFAENVWHYLSGKNRAEKEEKSDAVALRNAAELCEQYYLHEILSYSVCKRDKEGVLVVQTFGSSDSYPIFMFDEGQWQKFYKPKEREARYRFFSAGKKPEHYMFGIQQAFDKLENAKQDAIEKNRRESDSGNKPTFEVPKKISEIIICTGGSDALNVAALGYNVVWLNSETAELRSEQYARLTGIAYKLYNLPDIDDTGKREALKLARQYLNIHTIYLPDELRKRHDMRGKACKDVRDFFRYYKPYDFENLLPGALPLRFWDSEPKTKRDGTAVIKNGRQVYDFKPNNEFIYNFLYRSGFGLLDMPTAKSGEMMVHVDNNVVREVRFRDVNKFVKQFLKSEVVVGLVKGGYVDLINAFHRSPNFSESSISNLNHISLSFDDYGKNFQYMFFENESWKITAEGVEIIEPKKCNVYVWEDEVVKHQVKKNPDSFRIFRDGDGFWDIEILNDESVFMRFLINSSRVHWRKELEDELDKLTKVEREEYLVKYRWSVDGPLLSLEERREQKEILISKFVSFGYLLHRYKDPAKAFAVWVMDYNMDFDKDEEQSSGGTGKSMAYSQLENVMRMVKFEGRNDKITQNPHIFEEVTEHTDMLFVDDFHKYGNFDFYYSIITSFLRVNPKGMTSFVIGQTKAPKLCFTSNFSPNRNDKSTRRRLLFTLFSDYYHKNPNGEYREEREPSQEFGMSFFAEDFPEKEWNLYLNFLADCTKNWLLHGKIEAGETNVLRNIYRNQMGTNFEPWADVFFSVENGRLDNYVQRTMAYEDCKRRFDAKLTSQRFLDKLAAWCKYNDYVLNPKELIRPKDKRITQWVSKMVFENNEWKQSDKKESVEMLYIMTDKAKLTGAAENLDGGVEIVGAKKVVQPDLFLKMKGEEEKPDDMPF